MKCESPFTEADQDAGFTGSRMQRIQDTEGGMCELLHEDPDRGEFYGCVSKEFHY